jgi:hypothetical protein
MVPNYGARIKKTENATFPPKKMIHTKGLCREGFIFLPCNN